MEKSTAGPRIKQRNSYGKSDRVEKGTKFRISLKLASHFKQITFFCLITVRQYGECGGLKRLIVIPGLPSNLQVK